MAQIPAPPSVPAHQPLSDAEIGEMDDLLAAIPAPRESLDVVMLDGYLCGVLAQPEELPPARWLPPIFDWHWGDPDAEAPREPLGPDSEGWHAAKHERLIALLQRHHAVLEQQLREDGWFDPLVMEPQQEDGTPIGGAAAVQPALAPWVAGFEHALTQFPALEAMSNDELPDLLACVRRHLPLEDEDERAYAKALDAEHPLKSLDVGIEDLVANVVALADIGRESRFAVQTVVRETPKVGRNDPCPCGSGRKFKQCHGK